MKIEIGNLYFLILIPLVFAFIYYSYKKYKPFSKNELKIFISRIIIFTLLILAFGEITLSIKGRNISTVFYLIFLKVQKNLKRQERILFPGQ